MKKIGWREKGVNKEEATIFIIVSVASSHCYPFHLLQSPIHVLCRIIENWRPCQTNDHDTSLATGYFMPTKRKKNKHSLHGIDRWSKEKIKTSHVRNRSTDCEERNLVFIYLFLCPNWILFPFVHGIKFAVRVHRSMRKIIIISLDRTNNLLFRFIDLAPSKRDCIRSTNENEYSFEREENQFFDVLRVLFLHCVGFFSVSYANPFYEVDCIMRTAPIRWGKEVNCIYYRATNKARTNINCVLHGHVCSTLLHIYWYMRSRILGISSNASWFDEALQVNKRIINRTNTIKWQKNEKIPEWQEWRHHSIAK